MKDHPDTRTESDIASLRELLLLQIASFRICQKTVAPQVADYIAKLTVPEVPEESEILYLPSDFPHAMRTQLSLLALGENERKMLEGAAYDILAQLRQDVRFHASLAKLKKENSYGQDRHTRERAKVLEAQRRRDNSMAIYSHLRMAMVSLGMPENDPTFRPMTLAATFRKSTDTKRQIGDTYRPDGDIWTNTKFKRMPSIAPADDGDWSSDSEDEDLVVSTQLSKRQGTKQKHISQRLGLKGKKRKVGFQESTPDSTSLNTSATESTSSAASSGWIWNIQSPKGLTDGELKDWLSEGDRVQWFRAEAEMLRWQEEWEQKLAEHLRCIRYFAKLSSIWAELADEHQSNAGAVAFAKRLSAQFEKQRKQARSDLDASGYHHITDFKELVKYILRCREEVKKIVEHAKSGSEKTM